MKKRVHYILIFLLAVLLFANYANAQTWQQIAGRQRFTTGIGLPVRDSLFYSAASDTAFLYINPNDTTGLYWKYKGFHRKVGGVSAVSSVFGRTGAIVAEENDYSAFYPLLSGTYNNPSWINQLAWSKITGTPSFLLISDTAAMLSPYLRSNVAAATYVPLTRTITINGTTQDLSANRTFTISGSNIYNTSDSLTGNRFVNLGSTRTLSFGKGSTTYLHLFNNGNFWIGSGTPTDAGFKLDVSGQGRIATGLTLNRSGEAFVQFQNAGSSYAMVRGNPTSNGIKFTSGDGTAEYWGFYPPATGFSGMSGINIGAYNLTGRTSPTVIPALFAQNSNITTTNSYTEIVRLRSVITGNQMTDGFGGFIRMDIRDPDNVDNHVASIGFVRSGADNSGSINFLTANAGTLAERFRITNNGNLLVNTTTEVPTSILTLESTSKGFLPPRMTAAQASAISSPAEGLMVYVTDTNGTFTSKGWWGYNGANWEKLNN